MHLDPFQPISFEWQRVSPERQNGEAGYLWVRTNLLGATRYRQVEYSAGYVADHWCTKGHVLHVLRGELFIEHQGASTHRLTSGMNYLIGDESCPHKVTSVAGATVLVVD